MRLIHSIIFLSVFCTVCAAHGANSLLLLDSDKQVEVSVDDLRAQSDLDFILYDPFRGVELEIRGILLDKVLKKHIGRLPKQIKLTAHDGYELIFENWTTNNWVIVTQENGEPISLRERGPLRLVERDIGSKDPSNLRDFNDWVWMLKVIEALP